MDVSLPPSVDSGGTVRTNIGNILNTGMELTVGLTPVRQSMVTWGMQLNYSRNRNELLKLGPGVLPNPEMGLVEGYPVRSRWARPIVGFADQNGDGVLQPAEVQVGDSMVFVGRLYPNYTASLHTNLALLGGAVGISASFNYEAGASQVDQ